MILVTGAAGKTGQAVVRALIARDQAVRAWVRRPEQAETLERIGAREVVIGSMEDPETFDNAARGIEAIYLICPNMFPEEITLGEIAIRGARRAGCRRLVYHSVLHPQVEAMPHHWAKMRVEERLFESGLQCTILQPAAYMQNLLASWEAIVERGVYEVPYSTKAPFSLVDLHDVAEAAAIALTTPGHEGAIYELCGPEVLSSAEAAAVMQRVLDRPVRAEALALNTWTAKAKASGLGGYALDGLVKMFRYYDQYGFWGSSRVLEGLLGRKPSSFESFLANQGG
ncbi:MAG: NmrA family NAD(P)-binding protein [Acidobacteriota bacterium]